jgi:hypothetical protein
MPHPAMGADWIRRRLRPWQFSVTESSVTLSPNLRKRHARSTNTHPVSSRDGAAALPQMPVAHGGSTHYRGAIRIRALDHAMHQVRPYPSGAGRRRSHERRCPGLARWRTQAAKVSERSVMTHHRAYFMGRDGQFMKTVDLICNDDDGARKRARQMVDGHDVELWQHDRRIEKFEGHLE